MKKISLAISMILCTWMVQSAQAQTGGVNNNDTTKVSKGQPGSTTQSSPDKAVNPATGTDSPSPVWSPNDNKSGKKDARKNKKNRNNSGYGTNPANKDSAGTGSQSAPSGTTPPKK